MLAAITLYFISPLFLVCESKQCNPSHYSNGVSFNMFNSDDLNVLMDHVGYLYSKAIDDKLVEVLKK